MQQQEANSSRKLRSESGFAILLFALILPVVIILVYYAFNYNYADVVLTELQVAADNAAVGGSSKLCPRPECYKEAKRTALELLINHDVLAGLKSQHSLNVQAIRDSLSNFTDLEAEKVNWPISNNLIIRVERGFWGAWNSTGGAEFFTSFEDETANNSGFPSQHPGIPVAMIANAVRVQISRPQTGALGSGTLALAANATAVAGKVGSVESAPVALPICNLVNSDGKYYGDSILSGNLADKAKDDNDLCLGDRIFARADRFEPQAQTLLNRINATLPAGTPNYTLNDVYPVPNFAWAPCSSAMDPTEVSGRFGSNQPLRQQFFSTIQAYRDFRDDICPDCPDPAIAPFNNAPICVTDHGYGRGSLAVPGFAGLHKFPQDDSRTDSDAPAIVYQATDHFGVFGLPTRAGNGSAITEGLIKSNLSASMTLGEQFTVLESGPNDSDLDAKIWEKIIAEPGNNPRYSETDLGVFTRNYGTFGVSFPAGAAFYNPNTWSTEGIGIHGASLANNLLRNSPDVVWSSRVNLFNGLCNSKRASFQNITVTKGSSRTRSFIEDAYNVTATVVPSSFAGDSINDASPVWRTKAAIIAPLSPDGSAVSCIGLGKSRSGANRDPTALNTYQWIIVGFVDIVMVDTDIGQPVPSAIGQVTYRPGGAASYNSQSLRDWSFLGADATVGNPADGLLVNQCNVARARVTCGKHFLGTTQSQGERSPRLVR